MIPVLVEKKKMSKEKEERLIDKIAEIYKKILILIAMLVTRIGLILFRTPKRYYVNVLGPLTDSYSKVYLENIHNAKKS